MGIVVRGTRASPSLLNAHFRVHRVDREERPDVDRNFYDRVRAMRMGGRPLNVFLRPSARRSGAAVLPADVAPRRHAGSRRDLARIHGAWLEQREQIETGGARVLDLVRSLAAPAARSRATSWSRSAPPRSRARYDAAEGGFGSAFGETR